MTAGQGVSSQKKYFDVADWKGWPSTCKDHLLFALRPNIIRNQSKRYKNSTVDLVYFKFDYIPVIATITEGPNFSAIKPTNYKMYLRLCS